MPTKRLVSTFALLLCLTVTASASATTFHASPSSTRAAAPCTEAAPCKLSFALDQGFSGDEVVLAAGTYDHLARDPLGLRPGVVLRSATGPGAVRPVIEQTVPYGDCDGCPILNVYGDATLRDVDVAQRVEGGGAVRSTAQATIERSALRGRAVALWLNGGSGDSGSVRDVLAVAAAGTAIVSDGGGPVRRLENVTAIGRGDRSIGISSRSSAGTDDTVDAVNTIVRGDYLDVQALATGSAGISDVSTVRLRYSNFRLDRIERRESDPAWSNAQVETWDNNQHAEPGFVSATDFRQATGSPTIDNGRANGLLGTLDLDGAARTYGAKPDIGAYEWAPVPGTNKPPASDEQAPDGGRQTADGDQQQDPEQRQDDLKQPDHPPAAAKLSIARRAVTVKKDVAAITVGCAAGADCAGTLTLRSGKVKVGSARYRVAAGKRATVRVKLRKAARKLIARKRKLKVTAVASDAKATITLKLPARRR